ncbi:MAG: tetratricopeptide repeat protein [Rhizomicrobium sp.]
MTTSLQTNSLSPERIVGLLAEADRLSSAGRSDKAEAICREILAADAGQPGALNFLALLLWERGETLEAESLLRRAIAAAPREAALHNNLGNLYHEIGRFSDAEASLRAAIKLNASYPEAYYNLGITLRALERREEALAAQRRALALRPAYLQSLIQIGALLKESGKPEDAVDIFKKALAANRDYFDAHYCLGDVLSELDRADDALASFDAALKIRPQSYEALCGRANALVRARREREALEVYRHAAELAPERLLAHHEFDALAWSMGWADLNYATHRMAREKIGDKPDLMLAEATQRIRLNDATSAEELLRRAHALAPERVDIVSSLGRALAAQGRFQENVDLLLTVSTQDAQSVAFQRDLAVAMLRAGNPSQAARILEQALEQAPFDQFLLGFLTLAYRELGDSRFENIFNLEKFVRVYDLVVPSGFADAAAFNIALSEDLLTLHTRKAEPIDQSLRGGTQTMGMLFAEKSRAINLLRESIDAAVTDYATALSRNDRDPVSSRKTRYFRYSGSWSCNTRAGGYHSNHVHHQGWISSAYYAYLPGATRDATAQQGWLKFGESNFALSDRDRAEKLVQPSVGKLVLFPSYYWHGTTPFSSDDTRLTVAFDVVPVEESVRPR